MYDFYKSVIVNNGVLVDSCIFGFGAIVGSFLNVCIFRIPLHKSVVRPRSHCGCGYLIPWYDNIPILSWLILKGRCRQCRASIGFRYPLIETLTGGLFLASWLLLSSIFAFIGMLFASLLICAAFIDIDHMIIPDRFTIGGLVIGLLVASIYPDLHGFTDLDPFLLRSIRSVMASFIGAVVGSGFLIWIALMGEAVLRREAVGFGDVKLLGCIGAFCGWQGAIFSIFGGAVVGCVVLIVWGGVQKLRILIMKTEMASNEKSNFSTLILGMKIPFGPWLALGGLFYYIVLRQQVDEYFRLMQYFVFSPLY